MNKRVIFLVDGFNVYHSILKLKEDIGGGVGWLNLYSLCESYCKSYILNSDENVILDSVFYFSAIPYYLNKDYPNKIQRHKDYISCLESTGIKKELGKFKKKKNIFCDNCKNCLIINCDKCGSRISKREEKGTDVAIGMKVLEIFFKDQCDIVVLVTGDTDFFPVSIKCNELFLDKKLIFAFPYKRKSNQLATLAPRSFSISPQKYINHQFPNPMILKNGREIHKPKHW